MKLTKQAVTKDINQARSYDAYRLSKDEIKTTKEQQMKSLKSDIDKAIRNNQEMTIIVIH
jgi:hypothetical protein